MTVTQFKEGHHNAGFNHFDLSFENYGDGKMLLKYHEENTSSVLGTMHNFPRSDYKVMKTLT